jgi:hypothetical protein
MIESNYEDVGFSSWAIHDLHLLHRHSSISIRAVFDQIDLLDSKFEPVDWNKPKRDPPRGFSSFGAIQKL